MSKAQVSCDSQRPCSNCTRTYHKTIRVNPYLSFTEPHCTYDTPLETPVELNDQTLLRNLNTLEGRVEELETLIKSGNINLNLAPSVNNTPTPPACQPDSLPETKYSVIEELTDTTTYYSSPPSSSLIPDNWPLDLPPKPLLFHLVELFFTCCPNSRRVLHRPTFMTQLFEPPSSPRFPFAPILHSICAVAAVYSPLVTVVPIPDLHIAPALDLFLEKTRPKKGQSLMFDEEHFVISKYQCFAAARDGINLFGVVQACIINSWWALSCARWIDHWMCSSMGMRLCNAMGLHLQDSLWKPLPNRIREKLLIGPPLSHTDVELRRNVFWLAYCMERYHLFTTQWPFDLSDEDIQQTLPGTLEAFETGVDGGQERQTTLSADLFTAHGDDLDDFGLYLKCAIMLSRAHVLANRHLSKYDTLEEVQNSPEIGAINTLVSSMRLTTGKSQFNPTEHSLSASVSNLFIAHMAPHLATLETHNLLANWSDPSCESANRSLAAARSILKYASGLLATSWDAVRLDRMACLCWTAAGKALLAALKHAPESLAPGLRAEIRLIRNVLLSAGGRVVLFLRQFQYLGMEIVRELGEREAAKVFQDES
ncbi:hypothetical protein BDV93DRAFT_157295 [Ceratobasidium sp. AG-I]|nr:hypothetical protein BDV93DRAFT_157295 [Ceratobasidium sp. AG-I]